MDSETFIFIALEAYAVAVAAVIVAVLFRVHRAERRRGE
jgi:hypothetical protein